VASGAPGARRGPTARRSSAGTWPQFPRRAPFEAPIARWGRHARPIKSKSAFVGRPVRAGRAGWATRRPQAGPPRHDHRLVHELKREASAATPPAWSTEAISGDPRSAGANTWPHALDEAPQRPLPAPSPTPPPFRSSPPATPLCSAPLARPSCAGGQIAQVEWSGSTAPALSTRPLRTTRSHCGDGRRWQSLPPAPVTFGQYLLGPATLPLPATRKNRLRALREYHTAAAGRHSPPRAPNSGPPCPPYSREPRARPSVHLPPHSLSQRTARAHIPSIASGRSRRCSGGTLVSSCAARLARRGPRGAAAAASGGRARTHPSNTPTLLHSHPSSRVLSLHRRARWLACDAGLPWPFRFISRSPVGRPTRGCVASFASSPPDSPRILRF